MKTTTLLIGAILVVSMAVAACSGDDDSGKDRAASQSPQNGAATDTANGQSARAGEPVSGDPTCDTVFGIFNGSGFEQGSGPGGFASEGQYNVDGFAGTIWTLLQGGSSVGTTRSLLESNTAGGHFFRELIRQGVIEVEPLQRALGNEGVAQVNSRITAAGGKPVTSENVVIRLREGQQRQAEPTGGFSGRPGAGGTAAAAPGQDTRPPQPRQYPDVSCVSSG